MKVLALETSTLAGGVAVVDDSEGLIGEIRVNVKVAHSERLMPSIEWLLHSSGISIGDIDAFALSIGPGSFTGLRIGLSMVKGFAFSTHKPVVPVSTLDAFARTVPFCKHLVCPMLDARKKEIYTALYRWEEGCCRKVMDEVAVKPEVLLEKISEPVVFMGEGSRVYRELILERMKTKALFAPPSRMSPSAVSVAEIALESVKEGMLTDPVGLIPLYLRKSEAEIRWKG